MSDVSVNAGLTPSWILRESTADDILGILECWVAAFAEEGVRPPDAGFWRWKFFDNHTGPARSFVADDNGRIVGYYAVVPQTFLVDGKEHPGSIVVDVMTHPQYQRQGMFTKLGRYALKRCAEDAPFEFTTGYPIRASVIPGHIKVGWRIRFKIGTWIQVLSSASLLRSKVPSLRRVPVGAGVLGFGPTLATRTWSRLRLAGAAKLSIQRLDQADAARFDRFFGRLHAALSRGVAIQRRTSGLMKWRYDANPYYDYFYHAALDREGEIVGLAICRPTSLRGVETTAILDLLSLDVSPGRLSILRRLVADVRQAALDRGNAMLAMMVTQPNPIVPSPWKLGFLPTPFRFSLITYPLAPQSPIERDDLTWHLMWGDTDDV